MTNLLYHEGRSVMYETWHLCKKLLRDKVENIMQKSLKINPYYLYK